MRVDNEFPLSSSMIPSYLQTVCVRAGTGPDLEAQELFQGQGLFPSLWAITALISFGLESSSQCANAQVHIGTDHICSCLIRQLQCK